MGQFTCNGTRSIGNNWSTRISKLNLFAQVCHVPPGNGANPRVISISANAVDAHMANHPGDCISPEEDCSCLGDSLDQGNKHGKGKK